MFFWTPYDWLLLPAILLALYAQLKVTTTFSQYKNKLNSQGLTGAVVARILLDKMGLSHIPVQITEGFLGDHYDPIHKVVRLSPDIYYGNSIASLAVAAHEVGHAVQHSEGYWALVARHRIFPLVNIGSFLSWPLLLLGFFFHAANLIELGILVFSFTVLFQVITLPVEFNASSRAVNLLSSTGLITRSESPAVSAVLRAAALTYVAAAVTAVLELLRLILIFGGINRDE
ncbi:hypothetical protein SAMN02745885_02392 [Carboxydocella sporoproducens DSM 16521]|uniref:Zinc metallopeptidase n=2 Tax=Carboxydocella TaxID=178898 RepID=A0A1T4S2U9_9FIRM|nr:MULTISPECIES: zinc metallopeptidase [Carboxydocella]AVX20679.1 hypothetical protein CFE_1490 [Carboxydocella thermautotrophica]AVX31099.1 hypothetical protein CTH_1509 [Carboxydocella thermautotrophica]SKA22268.1 hypothetical protein SAMN02745885_02392 [Carboxydocella sporoproducens DSM 16521]